MSKSPSLRRIQADIRELALDPSDRYHAAPLENDMFEWHFTIRGADGTDFEGGVYHGRIMLPPEYPFKPPHIIFLTPSGRFETNTKVCLSFSAFHPELWQPAWGIRLILEALISFLPTPADGAIGALDWTTKERKRLAQKSVNYHCSTCGCKAIDLLPPLKPKSEQADGENPNAAATKPSRFQKEIEQLQQWQSMEHTAKDEQELVAAAEAQAEANKKQTEETSSNVETEAAPAKAEAKESSTNPHEPESEARPHEGQSNIRQQFAPAPAPTATPVQQHQQVEEEDKPDTYNNSDPIPAPLEEARLDVPPAEPQQHPQSDEFSTWMSDPLLNGIIVVLAIICFLLMRKLQALMDELNTLDVTFE